MHSVVFSLFLIFAGAAVLSTFALLTRQSLLVAYMLLGLLLGPFAFNLVGNATVVRHISEIGLIFLLFLLGLDLQPQTLKHTFKRVSIVGILSAILFFILGYFFGHLLGYDRNACLVLGVSTLFSSTIIGIKLLPTTVLHHQRMGDLMIGVLLLQDIIAILLLTMVHAIALDAALGKALLFVVIAFPGITLFGFLFERYCLLFLLKRFSRIKEYLFLVAIAWCLSMAELARALHLSAEMGAFIAGVSIATSPIAIYIAESLKPVRDFFLVLFFFSLGASVDVHEVGVLIWPALFFAILITVLKPVVYRYLFGWLGEKKTFSWELGFRLGQNSEFSLILAYTALQEQLIASHTNTMVQIVTILTFILSSYCVVLKYPTPMALSDKLRKD